MLFLNFKCLLQQKSNVDYQLNQELDQTIKRIKSKVMGTIESVDNSERNILKLKNTEKKCARFLIFHVTEANKTSFFRSRESEINFYKLDGNVNL